MIKLLSYIDNAVKNSNKMFYFYIFVPLKYLGKKTEQIEIIPSHISNYRDRDIQYYAVFF